MYRLSASCPLLNKDDDDESGVYNIMYSYMYKYYSYMYK